MSQTVQQVDQNALKTGQALTILLLLVAFVLNLWVIVAFVAIAQLLAAFASPHTAHVYAPYQLFYQRVVLPTGRIKPNRIPDHPEPHRFASLIGGIVNGIAVLALLAGAAAVGWGLVWLVIALANLNFWLDFCLGCWLYYQLSVRGVKGFTQRPIEPIQS